MIKASLVRMLKNFLSNIESLRITFLFAALIEIPRIATAFQVIHENTVFSVPLALMFAYAVSESWDAYFKNPKRYLLLFLNTFSLFCSIIIIAPTLLYIVKFRNTDVDLTKVFNYSNDTIFWFYVCTIAISTFLPLIVLAAVDAEHKPKSETKDKEPLINPIHIPSPTSEVIPLVITNEKIDVEPFNTTEEVAVATEESLILTSIENYGKTAEEISADTGIEVSKLISGRRWGLLRKLVKDGKIVKTGERYELRK